MATIEKFLGRRVEMPEDRRYDHDRKMIVCQ
jgi:hypothetical protein